MSKKQPSKPAPKPTANPGGAGIIEGTKSTNWGKTMPDGTVGWDDLSRNYKNLERKRRTENGA